MVVINGGGTCNVFWQVGSSAILGTGTQLIGNIIAFSDITLTSGANVAGRVLARNGAVTLDSNQFSACTGGGGGPGPSADADEVTLPVSSTWSLMLLGFLLAIGAVISIGNVKYR